MPQKCVFLVLPYLTTSKQVEIRSVLFRNSRDTEGVSSENTVKLKTLFELFFLHGELRIREMVYAILEYDPDDDEAMGDLQRRWSESCLLIEYLYTHPHSNWRRMPSSVENASMYLFADRNIATSYHASDAYVENVAEANSNLNEDVIPGFMGTLMRRHNANFSVVEGSRIYPPDHFIQLNIVLRDLSNAVSDISLDKTKWALADLLADQSRPVSVAERRALSAMRWFSDSCRPTFFADQSLLFLAVAFETLLNIDSGNRERVTERLRLTIKAIVGGFPRIDSWVEQFYDARSRVVHEGGSPDFLYYAVDQGKTTGKARDKQGAIPHRSLVEYGRTIFHLCVDTLLSGSRMAEEVDLQESLVHNSERLDQILQTLEQQGQTPSERTSAAAKIAMDLRRNWSGFDEFVDKKKLKRTLKRSIQLYNEQSPGQTWALSPHIEELVNEICGDKAAKSEPVFFQAVAAMDEEMRRFPWYDHGFGVNGSDPASLVVALVSYAAVVAPVAERGATGDSIAE